MSWVEHFIWSISGLRRTRRTGRDKENPIIERGRGRPRTKKRTSTFCGGLVHIIWNKRSIVPDNSRKQADFNDKKLIKIESDNLVLERLANADVPLWIRFDDEGTIKFNGDDLGIPDLHPRPKNPRFGPKTICSRPFGVWTDRALI